MDIVLVNIRPIHSLLQDMHYDEDRLMNTQRQQREKEGGKMMGEETREVGCCFATRDLLSVRVQ